jgi:flavin reductase (DIM6/NTAB) family NADH-FMN oxidoreductase RutF
MEHWDTHTTIEPGILYFGTPVVLISSENEDGSSNLAPMSSAFWLAWRCILGLAATSKTPQNMIRTGECVLNLPSDDLAGMVDRLALTTGSHPVPEGKLRRGYRHEAQKFPLSAFTPVPSETVRPPRVDECPVQLEAVVEAVHRMAENDPARRGQRCCIEVRVQRVHEHQSILMRGEANRITPTDGVR